MRYFQPTLYSRYEGRLQAAPPQSSVAPVVPTRASGCSSGSPGSHLACFCERRSDARVRS